MQDESVYCTILVNPKVTTLTKYQLVVASSAVNGANWEYVYMCILVSEYRSQLCHASVGGREHVGNDDGGWCRRMRYLRSYLV